MYDYAVKVNDRKITAIRLAQEETERALSHFSAWIKGHITIMNPFT